MTGVHGRPPIGVAGEVDYSVRAAQGVNEVVVDAWRLPLSDRDGLGQASTVLARASWIALRPRRRRASQWAASRRPRNPDPPAMRSAFGTHRCVLLDDSKL